MRVLYLLSRDLKGPRPGPLDVTLEVEREPLNATASINKKYSEIHDSSDKSSMRGGRGGSRRVQVWVSETFCLPPYEGRELWRRR